MDVCGTETPIRHLGPTTVRDLARGGGYAPPQTLHKTLPADSQGNKEVLHEHDQRKTRCWRYFCICELKIKERITSPLPTVVKRNTKRSSQQAGSHTLLKHREDRLKPNIKKTSQWRGVQSSWWWPGGSSGLRGCEGVSAGRWGGCQSIMDESV